MAISAQDVNKLRKMTGAGMMDCKKALTEADGDFDKAVELLRKKGQKVSASRSDRETNEGTVFVKTNSDNTEGIMLSLECETDFVSKNEEFQSVGEKILEIAFANKPADVEALKNEKFDDISVGEKITELVGKIGEKIEIGAYEKLTGDQVIPYIHAGSRLGVLVALKNTDGKDVTEAGRDVAMQIAAMNPVAVDKDGVDQAVIDREIEIGKEQARADGKPEAMLEKIATGKLNKFFKENTLLNQPFVKDSSLTIEAYLKSVAPQLTVSEFKRVSVSG